MAKMESFMRLPMLLFMASANVSAAGTHCLLDETVAFSCPVGSSKVASVCLSKASATKPAALSYRFGRLGAPELVFPASPGGSLQRFRYTHYFRSQVARTELGFSNAGAEYSVFDYYDGEEKPTLVRGVHVAFRGQEQELKCKGKVISNLDLLEPLVPCDAQSALSMGNCK